MCISMLSYSLHVNGATYVCIHADMQSLWSIFSNYTTFYAALLKCSTTWLTSQIRLGTFCRALNGKHVTRQLQLCMVVDSLVNQACVYWNGKIASGFSCIFYMHANTYYIVTYIRSKGTSHTWPNMILSNQDPLRHFLN